MNSLIKIIDRQKKIDNLEEIIDNINEIIKYRFIVLENLDKLFSHNLDVKILKKFFTEIGLSENLSDANYLSVIENLKDFSICSIILDKKVKIQPIFSNKEYALNLFVHNVEGELLLSNFDLVLPDFNDKLNFKKIYKNTNTLISELDKFSIKLSNFKTLLMKKDLNNFSVSSEVNLLNARKSELDDIISKQLNNFNKDGEIYPLLKRIMNGVDFEEIRNKGLFFDGSNDYRKAAFLGVIEDSLIILIKSITEAKTLLSAFIDKIPKEF